MQAAEWANFNNACPLIEEQGLEFYEADGEQIYPILALIEPLRWTIFVQNPGHAVPNLIRNFYENMDAETNTSKVRDMNLCVRRPLCKILDLLF